MDTYGDYEQLYQFHICSWSDTNLIFFLISRIDLSNRALLSV